MLAVTALCTFGSVNAGWAANFSVEPVRVILDVQHRTERMAIKNESEQPLTVLIKSYRWTQAQEGTDQYNETEDLIVFPRALTLAAGEERFVRVGMAAPSGPKEQAFRIYIEEQPIKDEQAPKGASARVLMRVGVPVFAQTLKPEPALKARELIMAKGHLHYTLTNAGNSFVTADQITINGLDDKGREVFAKNLGGVYMLAGNTRSFDVEIPGEQCKRIATISVTTKSEGKELHKRLNITSRACERK
jgi:fimbrial chaperone protein